MYLQVMIMIHPDLHGVNPNSIPLATAFTFTIARGILFWHYELAGFWKFTSKTRKNHGHKSSQTSFLSDFQACPNFIKHFETNTTSYYFSIINYFTENKGCSNNSNNGNV